VSEEKDLTEAPATPAAEAPVEENTAAQGIPGDKPAAPTQTPPAARSGGAVAWLALLLAVGLGAAAGWAFWEAQAREAALLQRLAELEASDTPSQAVAADDSALRAELRALERDVQDALEQRLDALQPRLQSQALSVQEQASRLEALESRLAEQRAELAQLRGGDRDSWLLAEVEYLLRLANQRLIMAGDKASAQRLLQSADGILRQLDSVGLHPVRRAVAEDLAALRALPELDVEGLYLRLGALVDQVAGLVIFELPQRVGEDEVAPADTWQQRLQQGYQQALSTLSHYIVVRRREVPVEALVDPQWEGLLRQNLVMLLQQAQVALLSGNQALYSASLQRARRWLMEFFLADEAAAAAAVRELDDLADEVIAVSLPDISTSLAALKTYTEPRLQRDGAQ
jgi:uroporphyrin-3 C-methyltransferase